MTLRKLLVGFNLSLLFILILSVALPLLLLGSSALGYFRNNTLGIGIMLVSFISINVYFARNWSLFNFLEQGDWYSLHVLLRSKIFARKNYSRQNIFYFIEVSIQLNNLALLRELYEELLLCSAVLQKFGRQKVGKKKLWGAVRVSKYFGNVRCYREQRREIRLAQLAEKRLCDFAIEFGLPYLVEDLGQESEQYFGDLCEFTPFQRVRYNHKRKWAVLFYAIALLVESKYHYAANLLEQLLLNEESLASEFAHGKSKRGTAAGRSGNIRADVQQASELEKSFYSSPFHKEANAKLQFRYKLNTGNRMSLQAVMRRFKLWRSLRENALLQLVSIQLLEDLQSNLEEQEGQQTNGSFTDLEQDEKPFRIDQQLIGLRRTEIQRLYDSPKHWSSHLLKEQSQNVAIAMIRQLISVAYDKQLRPTHQAYMAALELRNKASKQRLEQQHNSLH